MGREADVNPLTGKNVIYVINYPIFLQDVQSTVHKYENKRLC